MHPVRTSIDGADKVAQWLQPCRLQLVTQAHVASQILEAAAKLIAAGDAVVSKRILAALLRREQAGSTAIGHGFAIPHARIPGIDRPLTVYLRTAKPIPFDETGTALVSHFLVFIVPCDGADEDDLQLLAAVARLIAEGRFRRELDEAMTATDTAAAFRTAIARTRE